MVDSVNRTLGKTAVKLELISAEQAKEAIRILEVRQDIGEPTSIDRILFEQGYLEADEVFELQARTQTRLGICPGCSQRANLFSKRPGSKTKCTACKTKYRVPGADPEDPFGEPPSTKAARESRPIAKGRGWGSHTVGLLGLGAVGVGFGAACVEAIGTGLMIPVFATTAVFALLSGSLLRSKNILAAAGVGVALFTALVVSVAAGNPPGTPFLTGVGVDAHHLVAPLVLFHLVVLALIARPAMAAIDSPWLFLVMLVPLCYGSLYFASRLVPGVDVTAVIAGPAMLDRLPWYLHPGVVTLLIVFPIGALAIGAAGLRRFVKKQPGTLVRDLGLVAGLLLLAGFGLIAGALEQKLPHPELQTRVSQAVGDRAADWLHPESAPRATTAAAATEGR